MARTVYVTTELTGGGSGLDGVNGNVLVAGDLAFYINKTSTTPSHEGNYCGVYMATTRAQSESSPETLVPDSNAGSWNWEKLLQLMPVFHTTGRTATLQNYGVEVIRTTTTGVHILKRPRRGTYKKLVFATTSKHFVRLTTAVAGSLATPTVRFGSPLVAGSSVCCVQLTSRQMYGTVKVPSWIELAGRTTARWEITGISGSLKAFKFSSST